MKKKIILLLAAVLLLAAIPVTAIALGSTGGAVNAYDATSELTAKPVEAGRAYSFLIETDAPFEGLTVTLTDLGEGGRASVALRAFHEDVASTLASDAVASMTVTPDGETAATLSFGKKSAGKYLVTVENLGGTVAVLAAEDNSVGGTDCYLGTTDIADFDIRMQIMFSTAVTASEAYVYSVSAASADASAAFDASNAKYTVKPGTWVFTDALGRTSLTNAEVGDPVTGKTLAMFYWDWHVSEAGSPRLGYTPVNVQQLMEAHPEIKNDYSSSYWGSASSSIYFWNEPIYGYYASTDGWVIRRQSELLANAGVDAIFFDNTNGTFTWKSAYTAVFNTFTDAKSDGVDVPQVSFMLPFAANADSSTQATNLYNSVYSIGKWSDLWYRLEGKPFLMAYSGNLSTTLKNFFSFRAGHGTYTASSSSAKGSTYWGWLNVYPQPVFGSSTSIKQMTVSPAQNYTYNNLAGASYPLIAMNGKYVMGRSYTKAKGDRYDGGNSSLYGYNFAEQFEYALSKSPDVLFVTGWNEWVAQRHSVWPSDSGYNQTQNALPDTFTDEYSRDLEPTKGALKDNYYYQLVNFVRRYKGTEAIQPAGKAQAIDIWGDISQWEDIDLYFAAYRDNTGDRYSMGYGGKTYTETSGRNDIVGAQVSRDDSYVYFLIECMDTITSYTDGRWMTLYLDTDGSNQGWETFDYVVNKTTPTAKVAYLERFTGNGYETETVGTVSYSADGRFLQIRIPKASIGLSGYDFTINFSVTDNVHDEGDYTTFSGDIMDFYISGDVAPGGRFKYSYISTTANAQTGLNDYEKLKITNWYDMDFTSMIGLSGTRLVDMTDMASDLTSTGWTRTALLYIPEGTYSDTAEIGVFGWRGETEGSWTTGIGYNLSTGKVFSSNPTLFPSATVTPVAARGWVFFSETFDGTTQKVYLNGTLVYSATVSSSASGRAALAASAQNTMLLGGQADWGDADDAVVNQFAAYGVVLKRSEGYRLATTAAVIAQLYAEKNVGALNDPTEASYSYAEVLSKPWYNYDYTTTEEGTLQNTTRTAANMTTFLDMESWTKIARYQIPEGEYAANSRILVFGIKSTGVTGAADIETGVTYDLSTGLASFSNAANFEVRYQKAKPVTGEAYFLGTFSCGTLQVWLNGELILSGRAQTDLSFDLTEASQNQIFLNVYATYGGKRTGFKSQYSLYGVSLDYAFGYGHAASPSAAARFYAESLAAKGSNYDTVTADDWYEFSYADGLTGKQSVSVGAVNGMTGWTREVVMYLPKMDYGADDFIGIVEPYRTDDGFWFGGIRYNPATGLVSSTNTGLFPLKTRTQTPVASNGYVHFVETFDGTTQKVYVNGVLAYTAVLRSGSVDLIAAANGGSLLLGGYASAGTTVSGAVDVYAAYGIKTMYAKAYCGVADASAAAKLYCVFDESL